MLVFFILLIALSARKNNSFFKRHAYALAFVTATLFLLHPVQTQTISYVIQGQLEGIATLLTLSMTLCFLQLTATSNTIARYSLTTILFIFATFSCGTKEIAIVSPLLILLVDWFFVAQGSWQSLKKRWLLHALIALTIIGLYMYLLKPRFFFDILRLNTIAQNNLGNVITQNPTDPITPLHYFISQFKVILHYLWIFIWPFGISVEYDWVLAPHFFAPDCIGPLLLLMFLGTMLAKLLRNNPTDLIGFGALWFIISIIPRSSIIPSPELLVDYKTYLGSFGWLFILAAGLIKGTEWCIAQSKKLREVFADEKMRFALIMLFILPLGLATAFRNTVWRSGLDFWGNIIKNAPGKARAYNNYGVDLSQNYGKFAESIPYFKQALAMDKKYRDPYNNLAVAYAATKNLDLAIETLRESLRMSPYYPEAYNNIASFLLEKNDYVQAKKALDMAIQLRPTYGKAHFNLGRMYYNQGEHEKSWEHFKKCCMQADLDNETGFSAYGKMSLVVKKYDDAIIGCTKALECNPNNMEAIFNLANAYFFTKQYEKAAHMYERVTKQNSSDARIWYNLGETYFMLDRAQEALHCFEKIKANPQSMPQLYLRMASCHEKIGAPQKALELLQTVIAQKDLPEAVRKKTQGALTDLEQHYKLT